VILVDTSVWVDHLRDGNAHLRELLNGGEVLTHPFIIGELACGSLKDREQILWFLGKLPTAVVAEHEEVMRLVESKKLFSAGIGWIDAHLIASALLARAGLLTLDKRLQGLLERL
jgi:predicted nucleic acid-binding protein